MTPALLLQLLPTLITSATEITSLIEKITTELKQNTELTPEQIVQRDQHIAMLEATKWWTPEMT